MFWSLLSSRFSAILCFVVGVIMIWVVFIPLYVLVLGSCGIFLVVTYLVEILFIFRLISLPLVFLVDIASFYGLGLG